MPKRILMSNRESLIIPEGCIVMYQFNNDNMNLDMSGNDNNAQNNGVIIDNSVKSGKLIGNCAYFNNTYLKILRSASLNSLAEFSFEFWMYLSEASWHQVFLDNLYASNDTWTNSGLFLRYSAHNKFQFGDDYSTLNKDIALSLNKWYHVVATRTAEGLAKIYLDKELIASGSMTPRWGQGNWIIGKLAPEITKYESFVGYLNNFRIYNRSINREEVVLHYNNENPYK